MIEDVLLILGLIVLTVAGFVASTLAGLIVAGVALLVLSMAFADGKGLPWRS